LSSLEAAGGLPAAWAWVVVGDGPARARLEAALSAAARPHVHLAGRLDDRPLPALYERAGALVHPAHYEGSRLGALEAMGPRPAVVATRAGGIPDKVTDGVTGLLVEPGDRAGLASAIRAVVADPARRSAMGAAGRCRLRAEFAASVLVDRTLALYEELL